MMRQALSVLVAFLVAGVLLGSVWATHGETQDLPVVHICGTLTTQTWTKDYIYIVDCTAGIAVGHTLTIKPGTVVRFDGRYSLIVDGTLVADGTEESPIRFTSNKPEPAPGDWLAIYFSPSSIDATYDSAGNYTGGSIVRRSIFEYGTAAVHADDAGPFIAYNTIGKKAGTCCGIGASSNTDPTAWPVIANNTLVGTSIRVGPTEGCYSVLRNTLDGAKIDANSRGIIADNTISNVPEVDDLPQPGIYASTGFTITGNRVTNCGEGMVINSRGVISGNPSVLT